MAPNPRIIGDITAKLTVKNLPNIKGDPNYEATKKMIQLLYSNMKTPPMPQGGGHNDHIILITKPTIYTTLSNTACEDPPPQPQGVSHGPTKRYCGSLIKDTATSLGRKFNPL